MPIYDYTYQSWKGVRRGPVFRWMAIPKFTLMDYFKNRTFIWLFSVSWLQFIGRLAWIYILINTEVLKTIGMPEGAVKQLQTHFQVDASFFKLMIDIQFWFCLAFAFMLGANLISRDLAHNALVLYVSKPISRWEYFFGKFSVVFLMSLLLTWVQAALLYLLQVAGSPPESDWRVNFWTRYAPIFGSMTAYCLLIGASLSLMILAASSLVRNGRLAGLIFAIALLVSGATGKAMVELMQMPNLMAISPFSSVLNIGYYLFDLQRKASMDLSAALTGLIVTWVICGFIIWVRMSNAAKFGR